MRDREKDMHREFQTVLLSSGVKPSFQRLLILEYIVNNRNHPSAEMIFQNISKKIPTLSRTTVYNTLNLFVSKGILTTLNTIDSESHFDIISKPHAHFFCSVCGQIIDIDIEMPFLSKADVNGHKTEEIKVQFLGICSKCLKKNQKKKYNINIKNKK